MTEYVIELTGPPIAWAPSRVVRGGRHSFSPRFREKEHAQWEVKKQYQLEPIPGAVFIDIVFKMPIPLSTSKKMKKGMLDETFHHVKKPDIDNCSKYAIDCIKGIVILDDNQVCHLKARKIYAEIPTTIIRVFPL